MCPCVNVNAVFVKARFSKPSFLFVANEIHMATSRGAHGAEAEKASLQTEAFGLAKLEAVSELELHAQRALNHARASSDHACGCANCRRCGTAHRCSDLAEVAAAFV